MAKKDKEKTQDQTVEDEASDAADQPDKAPSERKLFPVVGVGASAGGLEALEQFISGLPEKNGIAIPIRITPPAFRNCSGANHLSKSCLSRMQ